MTHLKLTIEMTVNLLLEFHTKGSTPTFKTQIHVVINNYRERMSTDLFFHELKGRKRYDSKSNLIGQMFSGIILLYQPLFSMRYVTGWVISHVICYVIYKK